MTNNDTPQRFAIVRGNVSLDTIQRYMPGNYEAVQVGPEVLIFGTDNAGWTLEDYVIPRLASGLYFAEELVPTRERV